MQRLTKPLLAGFLFAVSLTAGYFTRSVEGHEDLSSLYDMQIQSWDEIPCLSVEENEALYKTLHLKPKLNPADCHSAIDGRFNKSIAFLKNSSLELPTSAFGDIRELLQDPLGFVAETVPELDFDFNQDDSIAYNAMQNAVYLGRQFFELDPFASTGVLLHEAWHSVKTDPGHEKCTTGDIAQSRGGCDQAFALEGHTIGGYSVTFAYFAAHGLYNTKLSPEKRRILVNEALSLLSTRFNTGVQKFASLSETLVILNQNRDVEMIHPLLYKRQTLAHHATHFVTDKLEFNQRNGGVLMITDKGRVYEWSAFSPLQRFYGDELKDNLDIIDAARLYLAADEYPWTSVLLRDHRIFKYAPVVAGGEWIVAPALDLSKSPELRPVQIATYHFRSAGFLNHDGEVYRFGQSSRGHVRPYMKDSGITRHGILFKQITGGMNTETFWGVSQNGDVHYLKGNEMVKLAYAPHERIQKVQVTILGVYLLGESGHVYYNPHSAIGDREFKDTGLTGIKDFAVVKNVHPRDHEFDKLATEPSACSGRAIAKDPYFPGFQWTLDNDRLYFGNNKVCSWVADKVKAFSFTHSDTEDYAEYKALLSRETETTERRIWTPIKFRE